MFFFEKKNQKTFIHLLMDKVFLLLFLQKKKTFLFQLAVSKNSIQLALVPAWVVAMRVSAPVAASIA